MGELAQSISPNPNSSAPKCRESMEKSELQYFRSECLASHNAYRAEHGTPPLVWNASLANAAQSRAEALLTAETLKPEREVGENIACLWGSEPTGHKVTRIWYEAKRYFDFSAPRLTSRSRPFCQVLWEGTRELGTGAATNKDGKHIVVARYNPPAENKKTLVVRNVRLHRTADRQTKRLSVGARWSRHFLGLKQFQEECLLTHNEYRLRHGAAPLQWSQALAWQAQCWAEHLARVGDLRHNDDDTVGENLAGMLGDDLTGREATDIWYDEIADYDFDQPGYGEETSNFSQLVWVGTEFLGVGRATEGDLCVVVAFYDPPGNVEGSFTRNVLRLGSQVRRRGGRRPKAFIPPVPDLEGFRLECLVSHNYYRARHGSPPLVLSAPLTDEAQYWAERLLVTRTFEDHDDSRIGLNILLLNQRNVSGIKAVEFWYNECSQYNFNSPGFDSTSRGFTQLVWYASRKLGIGKASDEDGTTVVVARYEPVGNTDGLFVPNVNRRGCDRGSSEPIEFQVRDGRSKDGFLDRQEQGRQSKVTSSTGGPRKSEVDENANMVGRSSGSPPTDYFNQLVWIDSAPPASQPDERGDQTLHAEPQQDGDFETEECEHWEATELDEAEVCSPDETAEHVREIRFSLSPDPEGTEPETQQGGVLAKVVLFEHYAKEESFARPTSMGSKEILDEDGEVKEGYMSGDEQDGELAECELEFDDVFLTHHEDEDSLGRVSDDIPLSEEREGADSDLDESSALAEFLLDNAMSEDIQHKEDERSSPCEELEPPDYIVHMNVDQSREKLVRMHDLRAQFDFIPVETEVETSPKEVDLEIFDFRVAPRQRSVESEPSGPPCDEVVFADTMEHNLHAEVDLVTLFKQLEGQATDEEEEAQRGVVTDEKLPDNITYTNTDRASEYEMRMEDLTAQFDFVPVETNVDESPKEIDLEIFDLHVAPRQSPVHSRPNEAPCDEVVYADRMDHNVEAEPGLADLYGQLEGQTTDEEEQTQREDMAESPEQEQTDDSIIIQFQDHAKKNIEVMVETPTEITFTPHIREEGPPPSDAEMDRLFETQFSEKSEESVCSGSVCDERVEALANELVHSEPFELWSLLEGASEFQSSKTAAGPPLCMEAVESAELEESCPTAAYESEGSKSTAVLYEEENADIASELGFVEDQPAHVAHELHAVESCTVLQEPGAVTQTLEIFHEQSAVETEAPEAIQETSYHISGEVGQSTEYTTEDRGSFQKDSSQRYCEGTSSVCHAGLLLCSTSMFVAGECDHGVCEHVVDEENEHTECSNAHVLQEESVSVVELCRDDPCFLPGEALNSEPSLYILEEEPQLQPEHALKYDDEEFSLWERKAQEPSAIHVAGEICTSGFQQANQVEDVEHFERAEDFTNVSVRVMPAKPSFVMSQSPVYTSGEVASSWTMEQVQETDSVELLQGTHWEEDRVIVRHAKPSFPPISLGVAGEAFNSEPSSMLTEPSDVDWGESVDEYEESPVFSECELHSPRSLVYIAAEVLTQAAPVGADGQGTEDLTRPGGEAEETRWENTEQECLTSVKLGVDNERTTAVLPEEVASAKPTSNSREMNGKESLLLYTEQERDAAATAAELPVCLTNSATEEVVVERALQYEEFKDVSVQEILNASSVSSRPLDISTNSETMSKIELNESEFKLNTRNVRDTETEVTDETIENAPKQRFVSHDSELDDEQEEERHNRLQENIAPELFEIEVGRVSIRSQVSAEEPYTDSRPSYVEKKAESLTAGAGGGSVEEIYTSDAVAEKLKEDEEMDPCLGRDAAELFEEEMVRSHEAVTETEFRGEQPRPGETDASHVEDSTVRIEQSVHVESFTYFDTSRSAEHREVDVAVVAREKEPIGEVYREEVEDRNEKEAERPDPVGDVPRTSSPPFDPCSVEFESALEDFEDEFVEEIDITKAHEAPETQQVVLEDDARPELLQDFKGEYVEEIDITKAHEAPETQQVVLEDDARPELLQDFKGEYVEEIDITKAHEELEMQQAAVEVESHPELLQDYKDEYLEEIDITKAHEAPETQNTVPEDDARPELLQDYKGEYVEEIDITKAHEELETKQVVAEVEAHPELLQDFKDEYVEEIDITKAREAPEMQQAVVEVEAYPELLPQLSPTVHEEEVDVVASEGHFEEELDVCDIERDLPRVQLTGRRQLGIYGQDEDDMPRYYVDARFEFNEPEGDSTEDYYSDMYVRQGDPLEEDVEEFFLVKCSDDYLSGEESDHRMMYVIQEEDNNSTDDEGHQPPEASWQECRESESAEDECADEFGLEEIPESAEFLDDDQDEEEKRQLEEYERLESFVILEEKLSQVESDEEFGVDDPAHASSSSQETLHDDGDLDATMTQAELQEIKTEDQELERESQEGGVAERHGEEKFCSSEPDPTSPDDLPGEVSEGADADRGVSYSGGLKYEVKSLAREGPPADDSEPRKETTDRPDLIRRRVYASREGSYSSSQSSDSALSSEDFPSPTPVEDLQGLTAFQLECLQEHNRRRQQHRARALVWSAALAESAQKWADYLAANNVLDHSDDRDAGENLASASGEDVTGSRVTEMWYDEVKDFNFDLPAYNAKCGHFTQLVWRDSREMGVAKALSRDRTQFIVSRYFPAGNVLGAFKDNVKPGNGFSSKPRRRKSSARRRSSFRGTPAESLGDRERFRTECLAAHNFYRSLHGSPALHWSPLLAVEAQNWAEKLAKTGYHQRCGLKDRGENVAFRWGQDMSVRQAVELWYDEGYEYDFSCPGFASNTEHFSQVVWASARELGMGEALAEDGTRIVVARYLPPGNVVGQFSQNVQPRDQGTVQP